MGPAAAAAGAANLPRQNDQTNLTIEQQNQTTFWADVQAELAGLAQPGETRGGQPAGGAGGGHRPARPAGRTSGISSTLLNRRISRQVRISARVLEVSLDSQHQLGVDWSLAAAKVGGLSLSGVATNTAFSALNGQTFIPSTVAEPCPPARSPPLVQALQEQGEVRAVSNPSVVSLSNQTAFVKVGTEQTFFSLSNSTTHQPGGHRRPPMPRPRTATPRTRSRSAPSSTSPRR